MAENTNGTRPRDRAASPSMLAARIVDQDDQPLIATHASKPVAEGEEATRYRYYVSHALHHGASSTGRRVPAREIERLALIRTAGLFEDPLALMASAWLEVAPNRIAALHARCAALSDIRSEAKTLAALITRVKVANKHVVITLATSATAQAPRSRAFGR